MKPSKLIQLHKAMQLDKAIKPHKIVVKIRLPKVKYIATLIYMTTKVPLTVEQSQSLTILIISYNHSSYSQK